jgi:hypothetical protein
VVITRRSHKLGVDLDLAIPGLVGLVGALRTRHHRVGDEQAPEVGSSNLNNRSVALDTECDLAVEARTPEERRAILSWTSISQSPASSVSSAPCAPGTTG